MKYKFIGLMAAFLACASVSVEAQLFRPFESFRVIKTEKFDIIYPKESEASALILASYADNMYKEVSSVLGIEIRGRIPVTFAPSTDMFNGYYSPTSNHILLFDTAMDLEWTTFDDNLKGLFLHELVHAVSMSTRSPFFRFFHRIFGNWVTPSLITAPLFMVEGAAISFESLSGFGRANDPRVKQKLRQAIHEQKFLTPFQASGVYDLPDQRGVFYEYGGLFSAWLQEQYGMEKYAQLWQGMGSSRGSIFSFSVYASGFYRLFRRVYGMNFMTAWNAFRDSLALNDLEENTDEILPASYRFFSKKRNSVSAMAAGRNEVFILDRTEQKIRIYDTNTETTRIFNTTSLLSYDLDVSADGTSLLVSGYHIMGERYSAVVTELRADSGRRTGRAVHGLYKARYFRDGVIGIRSELHNNCIVYEDFNGNKEILFRGNENLMFSGPQVVDNDRIVFITARNGVRELLLYNYASGELFRIENTNDNNDYWRYMRGLNVSEGRLFFSHNANDRMYKLASIDLQTMQAIFSDRDFSGGVFNPVCVNGDIFYRANFFSGDGVLRFPEGAAFLSGTQIDIALTPANAGNYGLITRLNTQTVQVEQSNSDNAASIIVSRPYFGILYMNPFNFWLPLALVRLDAETILRFDGFGLFSVIADPTDRNLIMFSVYMDIKYLMLMIENFLWQSTIPGIPMTLEFSDMVNTINGTDFYRDTRINFNASFYRSPGRWAYRASLGAGYFRIAVDNDERSAYKWEEDKSDFFYSTAFSVSNIRQRPHEMFGTGISLSFRGISITESFQPRIEGRFRANAETTFPLSLTLYGAYDRLGMNLHGRSLSYGTASFDDAASKEYDLPEGLNINWLSGAEVSIGLFSWEIQRNISHIYFHRLFGTLAIRNVFYDSGGYLDAEGVEFGDIRLAQSLLLKIGLVPSAIPLKLSPFAVELSVWGAWKFSNTITGKGETWKIGFDFKLTN